MQCLPKRSDGEIPDLGELATDLVSVRVSDVLPRGFHRFRAQLDHTALVWFHNNSETTVSTHGGIAFNDALCGNAEHTRAQVERACIADRPQFLNRDPSEAQHSGAYRHKRRMLPLCNEGR